MSAGASTHSRRRLDYSPLERLEVGRPVERIAYIAEACRQRRVLDLGAMDETAWQSKRGRGTWLHEEIVRGALTVDGVDSSDLIPEGGLRTGPTANIRRGDVGDPEGLIPALENCPEVIVAGELIEHLESPLQFLKRLVAVDRAKGATLILSTPNATAIHNVLIGLIRRESTHHDHLCVLSYKTLATLCSRAGIFEWEIIPYYSRFTEMKGRHNGLLRSLIGVGEWIVNRVEWLFPLLSFGYIVRIRL